MQSKKLQSHNNSAIDLSNTNNNADGRGHKEVRRSTGHRNSGGIPYVSTRFRSMEMSRLTRAGTAEPVSRDQESGAKNADREILIFFPVQLTTSRIGILTRLIHTLLLYMRDHV